VSVIVRPRLLFRLKAFVGIALQCPHDDQAHQFSGTPLFLLRRCNRLRVFFFRQPEPDGSGVGNLAPMCIPALLVVIIR
jgi:hypothetical protein